MTTANEHLQDELTARDVDLERYNRSILKRVMDLLSKLEASLLARVAVLDPSQVQPRYKDARLTRMLAEVTQLVSTYADALKEALLPDLTQLAKDEAAFGLRLFDAVLPGGKVELETIAPSAANLKAAVTSRPFQGRLLRDWVEDQPAATLSRLKGAIRQGVAEGQTIDQTVRAIRGTAANGFRDGVMEINRRGAEAMVRTAVAHTVSTARDTLYRENAELVKGVRMVATLDGRTTLFCISIDGKMFPLTSGPRPPFHIRCRTSSVPVLKSWKELGIPLKEAPEGTRASMDGQVPATKTYGEWLKGRSADFQREVLGQERAKLFGKGELSVDKFVDHSGHVYTLDELRKREPAAFARAGFTVS